MVVSLITIVFSLYLLTSEIHGEDTFDCTGHEDDSLHPMMNVEDCRYYWHCIFVDTVYVRAVKRKCPAGTEFDSNLKECEIASSVNCIKTQSTRTTRVNTTTTKSYLPITTTIMTTQETEISSTTNTSDLVDVALFEKVLTKISETYSGESETIDETSATMPQPRKRRRRNHRMLHILTSNEHKIEHFPINQTHGLLIHCNEIQRRQLRDLIYYHPTTTHSLKALDSSSSSLTKSFLLDAFSLTLCIIFVVFLQK
ncbi:unnamed protein product [Adineta ricciae]|uniref:Chitin-binding type-2 domain-containing protein n=1 Tax=Adineta ricciae TaxID=249248 RepID=A0A815RZ61_ADIRI|nr:unnamed protein product [Adineta ricciae]